MIFTTLLSTCVERSRLDWLLAIALDITTLAWTCLLVAWWL